MGEMVNNTVKMVMSEEIRAKMAKFAHFKPGATFPYVLKSMRESGIPKEFWPIYILKGKDGVEASEIEDGVGYMEIDKDGTKKMRFETGKKRMSILEDGIVDWKNVVNEVMDPIPFRKDAESGKIDMNLVRGIRPDDQVELMNAIMERSHMTAEELQGLGY